jgi:Flp pilus assembly protein CpaB
MVLAGIAFFVVGAAIVFFVSRNSDGTSNRAGASVDEVDVLIANQTVNAGAKGDDLIAKGLVEVARVPAGDRLADALVTPNQLTNATFIRTFARGEQITQGGLSISPLAKVVTIPDGFEAIAVSTDFVAGGAGYIAPGDLVNVYADIPTVQAEASGTGQQSDAAPLPYSVPRSELLLTNVRVIDVSALVAPYVGSSPASSASDGVAPGRATSSGLTMLLAVSAIDSEKLVFATNHGNKLYLTRVASEDAPPVEQTPGRDYYNEFQEEPGAAHNRSGTAAS